MSISKTFAAAQDVKDIKRGVLAAAKMFNRPATEVTRDQLQFVTGKTFCHFFGLVGGYGRVRDYLFPKQVDKESTIAMKKLLTKLGAL